MRRATENHPDWGDCPEVNYEPAQVGPAALLLLGRRRPQARRSTATNAGTSTATTFRPTPASRFGTGPGNVRIGSFAAGMVLQQATCPVDHEDGPGSGQGRVRHLRRLHLGARSPAARRPRRHVADVHRRRVQGAPTTPPRLRCVGDADDPDAPGGVRVLRRPATGSSGRSRGSRRSATTMPSDTPPPDVPLPDEPYALAIDDDDRHAVHRTSDRQHRARLHGRLFAVRHRAAALNGDAWPARRAALHRPVPQPVLGQQRRLGRRDRR